MVEILRISSFFMVFFYRRLLARRMLIRLTLANDASSSNLPIPFIKQKRLSQILHLRQPLFIILN